MDQQGIYPILTEFIKCNWWEGSQRGVFWGLTAGTLVNTRTYSLPGLFQELPG